MQWTCEIVKLNDCREGKEKNITAAYNHIVASIFYDLRHYPFYRLIFFDRKTYEKKK